MLYLPNELINYILIICDGITRERCTIVCKLFADILITFENINKKYLLNRDPILYREVTFLKFNVSELYKICRIGDTELLKYYLRENLDFNHGLHGSCQGGHMKIVKLIIEKGADDFNHGLYAACRGGHMNIIKLMIEKGANNKYVINKLIW